MYFSDELSILTEEDLVLMVPNKLGIRLSIDMLPFTCMITTSIEEPSVVKELIVQKNKEE